MPIKLPSRLTLTKSLFLEESLQVSKVPLIALLLEFSSLMCKQEGSQWESLTWSIEVESSKRGLSSNAN